MKKKTIYILVICLLIMSLVVIVFFSIRKHNYNIGKEQGYLTGYSIGYADNSNGNDKQDSQTLAGSIAPYSFGSSKWKGFMIGFPAGYSDGYAATITTTINN